MNRAETARWNRNVQIDPGGCWLWTGTLTPNGYGTHSKGPGAKPQAAHRLSYEHSVGPIPPGRQIDHVCHSLAVQAGLCEGGDRCPHRRCVNPEHLEVVTPSVNTLRSNHSERRVTQCPKGHPYDDDNTITGDGKRRCRTCDVIRKRAARAS